jgi:hypothetical protein
MNDDLEDYKLFVELYLKDNGASSACKLCEALYLEFEWYGRTSEQITDLTIKVIYSLVHNGLVRYNASSHGWTWKG